ncbi:MAG: hypothetical protein ACKOUM_10715, partial [Sphingopyxis sp.]
MAQTGIFSGAALATMDDKRRIAVPALLRNSIPGEGKSREVWVTTHEVADCFVCSGPERQLAIEARIERAEELAAQRGEEFNRFRLERT